MKLFVDTSHCQVKTGREYSRKASLFVNKYILNFYLLSFLYYIIIKNKLFSTT